MLVATIASIVASDTMETTSDARNNGYQALTDRSCSIDGSVLFHPLHAE